VRSVFSIGKYGDGEGALSLPVTMGEVPNEGYYQGFYPLRLSPERLFNLQYRVFGMEFESQIAGVALSSFQRFPEMPSDERTLCYFPGAWNEVFGSYLDTEVIASVQIGWVGSIALDPDTALLPHYGVWPPEPNDQIHESPFTGELFTTAGLSNCYFHDGVCRPFIYVRLDVSNNESNAVFVTNRFYSPETPEVIFEDSGSRLRLFGWGQIPLYVFRLAHQPPIDIGNVALKPSMFYRYADENGKNPVYDTRTGRQLITPVPRDISRAPIAV
jgi:hypothetical protein